MTAIHRAMMAAAGRRENIITAGLQLHLDAGDAGSYPGSGQVWSDLTANDFDFHIGETSSSERSDPTFNGSAGAKSINRRFTVPHGMDEIGIAPGADAGLGIRRDVTGIEVAVRRDKGASAGQKFALAVLLCVAADAAGGAHYIFAARRIGRLGTGGPGRGGEQRNQDERKVGRTRFNPPDVHHSGRR